MKNRKEEYPDSLLSRCLRQRTKIEAAADIRNVLIGKGLIGPDKKNGAKPSGRCEFCGWRWPAGVFNKGRKFCCVLCQRGRPDMLGPGRKGTGKNRKHIPNRSRVIKKLRERQGNRCGICQQPLGARVHIDHIRPLSKNGPHVLSNWQATHPKCNLDKGANKTRH